VNRVSLLAPLVATLACGSNPSVIPAGDFSGPTGLAIAPVIDRDLLFVANQGSNELRAIMLCTAPAGAPTTCPDREDQQLLPAPIRLVSGSIAAGKRPLRLAGARLSAGGVPHGAVLVAGLDTDPKASPPKDALRVIDAADLFAASQNRIKAKEPNYVDLPDPPIDVVAADAQGTSVTAVAATQPPAGGPGTLTVLTVTVDGDSGLAIGTATRQCALDFVPARLAVVPGDTALQRVYVADGTPGGTPGGIGDGAVEVSVPDIPAIAASPIVPAPPCPVTRRLPASDPADSPRLARPLRSLALNPTFTNPTDGAQVGPGSLLLGVTSEDEALCTDHAALTCPADLPVAAGAICVDHGTRSCGRGRLVLISTNVGGQSALLPAPPTPLTASGAPPMVPLSPPTPAREVAFAVTGLRLFASGNVPTLVQPPVVGLVSTEDGTTYFLDVVNRRFFNDSRDTGGLPPLPQLNLPSPQSGTGPTLKPAAAAGGASTQFAGWVNPGVTRSAQWKVVWHSTMPRLESLSGNLSRAPGSPTVAFQLPPGKSLAPWTSAPELQLGAGDFVRVLSYSGSNTCAALGTVPVSVDVPIAAIDPNGVGMQLQPIAGFDPGPECFASGVVGAVVEVHAGSTAAGAWMVFEGLDALGRMPTGVQFVILGPRFDYPFNPPDPLHPPPPPPARDVVVSFTVTGNEPTTAGSFFSFTVQPILNGTPITDGQAITGIRDNSTTGLAGFAGPIVVYSSPRRPDPNFFTALTGANSLLRATPSQFGLPNTESVKFFY